MDALTHLERKPRYGDLLDVTIDYIDLKGMGRARLEVTLGSQRQRRVFHLHVRKALPGEHVRVQIEAIKRDEITAFVEEYLTPSPERIAPRCPHFGQRHHEGQGCGGCVLQSLSYEAQLEVKRQLVARAMANAGLGHLEVPAPVGMDDPWGYRNKMEFSFGDDRQRRFALGLYPSGWHKEVISLEACHLAAPFAAELAVRIADWGRSLGLEPHRLRDESGFLRTLTVREGKRTDQWLIELTTTHDEEVHTAQGPRPAAEVADLFLAATLQAAADLGQTLAGVHWTRHRAVRGEKTRTETICLHGAPVLLEALELPGGHRLHFEIDPRAFFQPNTLQAERLYAQVIHAAGLASGSQAQVLDLYCGTGTIGLCLAPYAAHVTGVELVPEAVDNARQNARANGLDNVTFIAGDAGKVLGGELAGMKGRFDLAVVDPPRKGLMPEALAHLQALAPRRLVYVSCNPQSLARDLAALIPQGWRVVSLQPVDMFPQTAHIETVALLEPTT